MLLFQHPDGVNQSEQPDTLLHHHCYCQILHSLCEPAAVACAVLGMWHLCAVRARGLFFLSHSQNYFDESAMQGTCVHVKHNKRIC